MCGPYFNFLAAKPSEFHVHIYFRDEWERFTAETLADELVKRFPGKVSGPDVVGRVGPHTLGNIEVDVRPEALGEVLPALLANSQFLSILVHPRTGDEIFDHKRAALWIGEPVPFNEKFFEALAKQAIRDAQKPRSPKPPQP